MRTARAGFTLTHLDVLEAEAIHVVREVAAGLERPALLFSGGKDSIVLAHLARRRSGRATNDTVAAGMVEG